jgi:hypothetical protein
MASETEIPALYDLKFGGILRVVQCRAMAVLADDNVMGGLHDAFVFVGMAGVAELGGAFVADRKVLPVLLIGLPVPTVHVPPLADAETFRNIKVSEHKNRCDETEYYPKRSVNVIFHPKRLTFTDFFCYL